MAQDSSKSVGSPSNPNPPQYSVERSADQMMDELFSEINWLLEGGDHLPHETVKEMAQKTPVTESLIVPTMVETPEVEVPVVTSAWAEPPSPGTQGISPQETVTSTTMPLKTTYWDKILFGLVLASFLGVVTWFIQNRFVFSGSGGNSSVVPDTRSNVSEVDRAFVAYLQRSLEDIDNQDNSSKSTKTAPLPPSLSPSTVPNFSDRYIVLYPPASPTLPQPQVSPSGITPSVSPSPKLTSLNVPPPPSPSSSSVSSVKPSPVVTQPSPVESAPFANVTLQGLLESGETSQGLFLINGATQRVRIGEAIGSSGWTLVAVTGQKAVIRRNGEVRSIYTGQQF